MSMSELDELGHQTNLLAAELDDLKLLVGLEDIRGGQRCKSGRRFTNAQRLKASERAAEIIVEINALLESSRPLLRKCDRFLIRAHSSTVSLGSVHATSYHASIRLLAGELIADVIGEFVSARDQMGPGFQFELSQLPSAEELKPKLARRWPSLRRIVESGISFEFNDLVPRLEREIVLAEELVLGSGHAAKRSRRSPEELLANTEALIRTAIKKLGKDTSADALYEKIGGARATFFEALRNLEARGEWTGRQRSGRRDMRADS